ncbi:hypothetical protein DFH09DRAFT_1025056 [Mycena vulgaris]|nr:hypothetical protein DFH09DRAFT_1025056 [Mycena vulgaris]
MTLYKEAFSDGIVAAARAPGVNHLDLGPLYQQTITHLQTVIDNPDLLLDPTTPCSEATADGKPFRNQFAVDSVHFIASKLPHLESILVAFLKGALETWKKKTFSSEYDEDGPINSLTPAEKVLYFIPPTNDRNESVFGGLRLHSRYRSASTVAHFSAHTGYHLNETEAFSDAMLNTQEDALYIMRLARAEDASGAMQKFREELLAFKQRIAEESREKQKAKEAEAAAEILRLQSILIITDPDDLKALPVKKKNSPCLREQLDVRRDLWKDDLLVKTKLKNISKKADMLAAILAADQRRKLTSTDGL